MNVSEEQLRAAVSDGVKQAFTQMGIDVSDPIKMQQDFAHLRQWRETSEMLKKRSMVALITTCIGGFVALVVMGVKAGLHGN